MHEPDVTQPGFLGGSSLAWPSAFIGPWSSLCTSHVPRTHLRLPLVGATVLFISIRQYSMAISSYELHPLKFPLIPQICTGPVSLVRDHDLSGFAVLVPVHI